MRRFKEKKDKMKFPHEMTFKELIIYIVSTILIEKRKKLIQMPFIKVIRFLAESISKALNGV